MNHGCMAFEDSMYLRRIRLTLAAIVAKYWNAVIVENVEQLPVKPDGSHVKTTHIGDFGT